MLSGGRRLTALSAMCARKMPLARVACSVSRRNSSSSVASPWMQRRSKNTQVSISALGSGCSVHLRKYSAQRRTGCRHSAVRAIISPGQ